ncbi:MAG: hypothetical protein AAF483_30415 [Planctomycetota bacterium]
MKRLWMIVCLLLATSTQTQAGGGSFERLCDTLTGNCCDSSGCDARDNCGSWYAQTEAVFLSPLDTANSQVFSLVNTAPATTITAATSVDADEFTATPRLTLGRQFRNGWGLQARYWDLNVVDGNGFAGPFAGVGVPPSLELLGGVDSVQAYTIDVEATKCVCIRGRRMLGTFGVRHGALEHRTTQSAFGVDTGLDNFVLSAVNENAFHGTGVTYSLMGTRPLSSKCFSLYAGGRLSHLFGEGRSISNTSAIVASPFGTAASTNGAVAFDDEILTIFESQVGLQWARCLLDCRAKCFARIGFEYQYWTADDNLSTATSFAAGPAGGASVSATSADFDTHFVGLGFSTGFAW